MRNLLVAAASLALIAGTMTSAAAAAPKSFSPAQQAEIGDIVKQYLLDHPEVLVDAMNALQAKQDQAAKDKAAAVIKSRPGDIYNDGYSFVAGNPNAKVTLVEFFDYNCGYCRKAFDKMMTLAAPNSKVRFVFKEFPILSPESEVASKAAFAASKQNKYLEFHRGLMSHSGRANEQAIEDVAKKIGLNMAQFHKDMNGPDAEAHVSANLKLGSDLGLDGTPSFIVNGKVISGWSEKDVDAAISAGKN
ncbi:MAG: DsbA family protein [Alphaproteobacteria bacterium]